VSIFVLRGSSWSFLRYHYRIPRVSYALMLCSHDEHSADRATTSEYVKAYSKVAIGTAALGQSLANVIYEVLLAAGAGADSLLLELDLRHDVRSRTAQLAQRSGGKVRSRWKVVIVVVVVVVVVVVG
jgi:hypothetical protein